MLRFFDASDNNKTEPPSKIEGTVLENHSNPDDSINKTNYLFVSMQEISWIKHHLKEFPQYNGKTDKDSNVGVCSTVIISGKKKNVRVHLFCNRTFGFVLNHKELNIFQGDIHACNSLGKIYTEFLKNEAVNRVFNHYNLTMSIQQSSKHPNKIGYMRYGRSTKDGSRGSIFTTNLARKDPHDSSVYHSMGTPDNYANAIINIYFEHLDPQYAKKQNNNESGKKDHYIDLHNYIDNHGIMKLNEAIAFRKRDINPIVGLIITDGLRVFEAKQLRIIMLENPHLQLYLYNPNATEHILRFISNEQGISYLSVMNEFEKTFQNATPYEGFTAQNTPSFNFYENELQLLKNIIVGWSSSYSSTNKIYYNFDDYNIAEHYLTTIKKNIDSFNPNIINARVAYSEERRYGKYSFYLTQEQYDSVSWVVNINKIPHNAIKNLNEEDDTVHMSKRFKKY